MVSFRVSTVYEAKIVPPTMSGKQQIGREMNSLPDYFLFKL
ncbi:protein of unknown function [Xenorhabdus poinarii G6]|uniref:Uncharacterized protein n=1 Tax=Xenorhabdus poinarii G6 TaxID=1354304 RepID=A0A068R6P0_9GAMM|nr:protein of unknown function [Xenorhabdus poinarii G6]